MILISATNRGSVRRENDFYETPEWVTQSLIDKTRWSKDIKLLEPCVGTGAIEGVLRKNGYLNIDWCEIARGKDFFEYSPGIIYDAIVTNPPYTYAQEFIDHGLAMADEVYMLLRINFLGAQKRYEWWSQNYLKKIYVLSRRPKFIKKGSDATEYGWFVFSKHHQGNLIEIDWLL